MRIKEFSIIRYGPLQDAKRVELKDFNLFFGRNEDGKTLTIDALIKLLFGKKSKEFEGIDRVDERPEGYVIIENDGKFIKLPEKGDLLTLCGLTPSECRNIFIIRDSDLSIKAEDAFYTDVTEKLVGLKTKKISKIKEVLQDMCKITPTTRMFKDIGEEKLKTRLDEARKLVEEIKKLEEEVKEKGFDKMELEQITLEEEMEKIEEEIQLLEDARKREKYEKGEEASNKLKEAKEKLEELKNFSQDEWQKWRDAERDIQRYRREMGETFQQLEEKEKELKRTKEMLDEAESEFALFEERKKILDEHIKPQIKVYQNEKEKLAQTEAKTHYLSLSAKFAGIFLFFSLLASILRGFFLFYLLSIAFSCVLLFFFFHKMQFLKDKGWIDGMLERIRLSLSPWKLDAACIEGILQNIEKFEEEYRKKLQNLQRIKERKERLSEDIKALNEEMHKKEIKIKELEENIEKIKMASGKEKIEEYEETLKLKKSFEELLVEKKGILTSLFGEGDWEKEIENLKIYKERAKDIKYNDAFLTELSKKKESLEEKMQELKKETRAIYAKMKDIEREANGTLREKEYFYCETSTDLKAMRERLQKFLDENERKRDDALKLIKLFEEIEKEEKEKVMQLFGEDSPVSYFFKYITAGLYKKVIFNKENEKIEVLRSDEKVLDAKKLSGGTFDQLYLCVRIALGEKILKGKKGFFIMDDPFIKSDRERLQRQVETLKRISENGWQIIYFSAKEEIKDALCKIDNINYIELPHIYP